MYTPFASLPANARLWVYQADRDFTEDEKRQIEDWMARFTSQWKSHGADLTASFRICYNRFIVVGVDANINLPSGCSIDSSVSLLKEIEKAFGLKLFDRTQVAFLEEEGRIATYPMNEIKTLLGQKKIDGESMTFNNLVDTKAKFEDEWLISLKNSWMKKYLKASSMA